MELEDSWPEERATPRQHSFRWRGDLGGITQSTQLAGMQEKGIGAEKLQASDDHWLQQESAHSPQLLGLYHTPDIGDHGQVYF